MKKNILLVFGVGDTFCGKDSYRFLKAGEKIVNDVQGLLKNTKKDYFGFINLMEYNDSNDKINPFHSVNQARVIDFKLFNTKPFSTENYITVKSSDAKDELTMAADQFSYLLPPDEYNLFVCGIDINGAFAPALDHLIKEKYYITVYSDVIKPYSKETIEYLINKSKDRDNHLRFGKS